ncbi:MAG: Gfo/Idh/MocA family oxidoreductase [Phycisphaerales bacterium]|nr:Gfo/Idh/MocA family oxidoreductase [Phycisphaerales bacterium]
MTTPLRLAVIGMEHGHVEGVLDAARRRADLEIVGVWEPDHPLFDRLAARYGLPPQLRHEDLEELLQVTAPEAASVMTAVSRHVTVAEVCAPRGVHMLFEKPLAFSVPDAAAIARLSRLHDVHALTNFETSWYTSVREAQRRLASGAVGPLRRMVFRHGHKGPRELGCFPEFLRWLTDPAGNGAGAAVDFGCYGAVLATWLMGGQRPTSIVASRARLKPDTYPLVDDDATITLTYPGSTAVLQASWAWTHDNKEMDLYAEGGSLHAGKWNDLWIRRENGPRRRLRPAPPPPHLPDEWTYLRQVCRGRCPVDPLSGLEANTIVAEILEAACSTPVVG